MNNRFFASLQFVFGLIAIVVVVVSYSRFGSLLRETFVGIASTSDFAKNNSEVLRNVVSESATATGEWLKLSSSSEGCASEATMQAFATIRSELPKLTEMISNAALISSSMEKSLPLSIPSVAEYEKIIKIPAYYIESGTQMISLPFDKISTDENKKITYISGIQHTIGEANISSCKKSGNQEKTPTEQPKCSTIKYVNGVTPITNTISIEEIVVTPAIHQVSVEIPKISMKEQSFNIQEVKLTSQSILGDVKKQLQILSQQLSAMSTLPGVVDGWIQLLQKELEKCPAQPHADEAKKIIAALHNRLIDLQSKIKTPEQHVSVEVFKAAADFLPCLFLILGLLSAGMAASGGAKLFVKGKKKQDGKGDGQTQNCGNEQAQVVQQEPLPHNSQQQSTCEQSAPVEQQQR